MKLLFFIIISSYSLVHGLGEDVDEAVFNNRKHTAKLLELLDHDRSNKLLINTIVKCLNIPLGTKISSNDFLRCVNNQLHTDDQTNIDSLSFILGNYLIKSASLFLRCNEVKSDLIYCTRVFGDCLPMFMRNIYGINVASLTCDRLIFIDDYDDLEDDYFPDDDPVSYDTELADRIAADDEL